MMIVLALLLLFLGLFLEGVFLAFPLVFAVILIMHVIFRSGWIFFIAFLAGVLLDLMLFRSLGQTGLYFLSFLLLLVIYERKFETRTASFLLFSSLLGGIGYLVLFGSVSFLVQLSLLVFLVLFFYLLMGGHVTKAKALLDSR